MRFLSLKSSFRWIVLIGVTLSLILLMSAIILADDPGPNLADCVPGNCPSPYPESGGPPASYTYFDNAFSAFVGGSMAIGINAAETEGRLAVGGDVTNDKSNAGYSVGASGGGSGVVAPDGSDHMIVRGNVRATNSGWFDVGALNSGGNAIVGGTVSPDNNVFKFGGTNPGSLSAGVGTDPAALGVDFDAKIREIRGRSQCWSVLPATGTYDAGTNTFTGDGSSALQVFYVDTDVAGVGPSFVNVPDTATVLVNFTGASLTWDVWGTHWGDTSTPIGSHREQVLFNFYEPTSVTFGGGSNGPTEASVLVPRADSTTTVGADINGRVITGGDLEHTNSEIHNYPFTGVLPACDWGDHPDTPYPTVADAPAQAASHVLTTGLYLGECVDGEPNGQPSTNPNAAVGDDNNGSSANPPETLGTCAVTGDDEDGVQPNGKWTDGQNGGSIIVDVVAPAEGACLNAWIDWTDTAGAPNTPDGDFNNGADYIIQNMLVSNGAGQIIDFDVPAGTFDGVGSDRAYHTRYRLTRVDAGGGCANAEAYGGAASPNGPADSGEVEDYVFNFTPTSVTLSQQQVESATGDWRWIALLGGLLITVMAIAMGWQFSHKAQ